MMNLPLYIDPGTGSMLFSILIGAATTLFFLSRALFIKLKVVVSGGKAAAQDKSYKKFVVYCEDKRYYTVFLPVAEEFERRKIGLTYFTGTKDDPIFSREFEFVKPECIGTGNVAYAKLNMLSAGFVLMTTPGLQVYQLKRSKNVAHYGHIFHSTTDSSMYRLFGLDYFDSVLMTGDYQADDIRLLEKQRGLPAKELVTVGCTYLDLLKEKIAAIPAEANHEFTVLVSPSWGKSALLGLYGERLLDPLVASGMRVIVRPHPQSRISEKEMLDRLQERYKDAPNLEWDGERDNIFAMRRADLMISDFSGIVYDYTFLCDKPVMYANAEMDTMPYDIYDTGHEPWAVTTLHQIGIPIKESDFPNIAEVIRSASDSPELARLRAHYKAEAWQHIGEAGRRTADFMVSTMERIDAEKAEAKK